MGAGRPVSILIVEDDADLLRMISKTVSSADIQTFMATSIADAKSVLLGEPVDIVLSDIQLQGHGSGGYQVLELCKEIAPSIDCFLMTGYLDERRNEAIRQGAAGVIQKPFTPGELINWLHMSVKEAYRGPFTKKIRYPIRVQTSYGKTPDKLKHQGCIFNISLKGMLLGSKELVPNENETFYYLLTLPSEETLVLPARRRWTKNENIEGFPVSFGIEFGQLTPEQSAKLSKYIKGLTRS